MIKLLEGIKNTNGIYLYYEPILKEKLKKGIGSGELINTYGFRNIGKTYQLIELAKQTNWIVVEPNNTLAKYIKDLYCYNDVYGQDDVVLRSKQIVLVDENVNVDRLIKRMGCKIITGYTTINDNKEIIEDLDVKLIKELEKDARGLTEKLEHALNSKDFSEYKMLINNLKDTVYLRNEIKTLNPYLNLNAK